MISTVTSATEFYLSVYLDRIWVTFNGTHGGKHHRMVTSAKDFDQFLVSKANEAKVPVDALRVWASSTMDYPEEYTSNLETVKLAHVLRMGVEGL